MKLSFRVGVNMLPLAARIVVFFTSRLVRALAFLKIADENERVEIGAFDVSKLFTIRREGCRINVFLPVLDQRPGRTTAQRLIDKISGPCADVIETVTIRRPFNLIPGRRIIEHL